MAKSRLSCFVCIVMSSAISLRGTLYQPMINEKKAQSLDHDSPVVTAKVRRRGAEGETLTRNSVLVRNGYDAKDRGNRLLLLGKDLMDLRGCEAMKAMRGEEYSTNRRQKESCQGRPGYAQTGPLDSRYIHSDHTCKTTANDKGCLWPFELDTIVHPKSSHAQSD